MNNELLQSIGFVFEVLCFFLAGVFFGTPNFYLFLISGFVFAFAVGKLIEKKTIEKYKKGK